MAFIKRVQQSFHRLQWKLTLSYTAVTLGALLTAVLILGLLLFSTMLAPHQFLPPAFWIKAVSNNVPASWRYALAQSPVDTDLLDSLLTEQFSENHFQVSYFDLFRVGDLQLTARTLGQASVLMVDPDGLLLATSNPEWVSPDAIGQPVDTTLLPDLEEVVAAAMAGDTDPDRLFVNIVPYETFYFAIPIFVEPETSQQLLAVVVMSIESLPTESDLIANALQLTTRSVLLFLLVVGLLGALFGAFTAKGMVKRLDRVSQVTDAWSQGDFSDFITDPAGDEISQLALRLNHMAEQLQHFLKRRQEMAVSEERNRLALDLHDSTKQEALAASFHIGTALTLFERQPEEAKNHLIEADNLVDSVRKELSGLILELRPPVEGNGRFDETINDYLIAWAHQTGIRATLKVTGFAELPLEIKQGIYRLMQEALANVARHSLAQNVDVTLAFQDHAIQLAIIDDGVGFDTQQQYQGMGLHSMQERAQSLLADFRIKSQAGGKGTKITLTVPIG